MAKAVSKSEAIRAIAEAEALEVVLEIIDRNETTSSKQTKVSRFVNDFQKQIKDERDVVLIAVKVK
jgi:hypothetical protein